MVNEADIVKAISDLSLQEVSHFESILLHLPGRDLLLAQRVCTSWKYLITHSIAIQRALFFVPEPEYRPCDKNENSITSPASREHGPRVRPNTLFPLWRINPSSCYSDKYCIFDIPVPSTGEDSKLDEAELVFQTSPGTRSIIVRVETNRDTDGTGGDVMVLTRRITSLRGSGCWSVSRRGIIASGRGQALCT
jgi:hypothetical protein